MYMHTYIYQSSVQVSGSVVAQLNLVEQFPNKLELVRSHLFADTEMQCVTHLLFVEWCYAHGLFVEHPELTQLRTKCFVLLCCWKNL